MKHFSISLLLCFIAGAIYALAYPSMIGPGWLPLVFISLPLFLWRLESTNSFKKNLLQILCFNLGLNVVGYYWIPQTLREFGQLPYVISLLLGCLFAFILQPHWWVYAIWKKYRPSWNWQTESSIILTALVMSFLERYIPQQFPSYVGSPWLHLKPYLGLVPVFGVFIFSFITYWASLEAVNQLTIRKFRPQVWIVMAGFIILNAALPLSNPAVQNVLPVRIVQANVGNFMKIASESGDEGSIGSIINRYYEFSVIENGFTPKLIVWPETAYPHSFSGPDSRIDNVFRHIHTLTKAEILIGGYDEDFTKSPDTLETVYNSSLLITDNRLKMTYHKNILIPFGETLPFGPFNGQIVSVVPAVSLFARGQGTPRMETLGGHRFVTPICYEILESEYMRSLLNQWKGNHFIVNHTNDSWYGDTAEPHQHLFLSKWRALEFQLPIIRSTNTGISSVIFPDGSESKRLGVNEQGNLDVNVPLGSGEPTFYLVYGMWPTLGLIILLFGLTFWREKNGSRL